MENRERNRIRERLKNGIGTQETRTVFYWICAVFGTLVCIMVVIKFILESLLGKADIIVSLGFTLAYLITLTVYTGVKEWARWFAVKQVSRLGEYFVFLWSGVYVAMEISAFIFNSFNYFDYPVIVPGEVYLCWVGVFLIFTFSYISKLMHEKKNQGGNPT